MNDSGVRKRIARAPSEVKIAQHSAAPSVRPKPTGEPLSSIPTPEATTITTPTNETATPAALAGLSVSAPTRAAITAVNTGVAAISSAESPAGIVCRPTVHSIWYAPNPSAPSNMIRHTSRGGRIEPSDQRRMSSKLDAETA